MGDIELRIPKLRSGSFFPEDVIERYCRVDRALVAAAAEMYVMGISTRKVEEVAARLGVRSMSKSEVSRLCSSLDAEVAAFRSQRFDGVRFAYLWLDATYVKCRVDGRSSSQAVVTAIGLDETGHKRFLGVECMDAESYAGWREFLSGLRGRGVDGVVLVVSDAHEGLAKAVSETFCGAAWQRCVTHLMRNVSSHIHKKDDQRRAREALKATFAQKSPLLVRACYQRATEEVAAMSPAAGRVLLEAEDAALAYLEENPETDCVVSGGQGFGEVRTEADAMAEYLVEHGLDEGRITKEERSSTTAENLRFSSALLEPGAEVGIVTNDFHLYRALRIAERNGLPGAHGLAAPSNPLYLPQAMLRECVAVVKDALFGNM